VISKRRIKSLMWWEQKSMTENLRNSWNWLTMLLWKITHKIKEKARKKALVLKKLKMTFLRTYHHHLKRSLKKNAEKKNWWRLNRRNRKNGLQKSYKILRRSQTWQTKKRKRWLNKNKKKLKRRKNCSLNTLKRSRMKRK